MSGYRDSTEVKTADWASFLRAAQDSLIKEHTGIFSLAHGCVQKAVSSVHLNFHPDSCLFNFNVSQQPCRFDIFPDNFGCITARVKLS